jgi:streptomycin 6-kinase
LPDLESNGAELLATPSSALPQAHRHLFEHAQALWPQLIASTTQKRLLHGDLHHDNILKGSRGQNDAPIWCAIDTKGFNGDPAYEFANAFRNPSGMNGAVANKDRMQHMAQVFSDTSGLNRPRILQFAFTHCASPSLGRSNVSQAALPPKAIFVYWNCWLT